MATPVGSNIEPLGLISEPLGLILGPAVILVVGIGAWCIQVWISKKRATLDFISRNEIGNPEWQKATRRFAHLTRNGGLTSLASENLSKEQLEDRLLVGYLLNHCEVVAVAIRHGVFNERIYKDWNRSRYIESWDKAQGYIGDRRTKRHQPTAYIRFEELAKKWREAPATR